MEKKTLSIIFRIENYSKLKELAKENARSMGNQLNLILEEYFEKKND